MIDSLVLKLSAFVIAAIIGGSLLCLPLFKWDFPRFFSSSLWTKIIWWIPIYIVFLFVLTGGFVPALIITLGLIIMALYEAYRRHVTRSRVALVYLICFMVASWATPLTFLLVPAASWTPFLVTVAVCSVLSDVAAFFFGTYAPVHRLPQFLNRHKSWEGVGGQIIGAAVGAIIVIFLLGITVPVGLALLIGIASAVGDLFNSAAKRSLNIKDWGQTIPGHGGILDRLSSLSFAFAAALIYVVMTGS